MSDLDVEVALNFLASHVANRMKGEIAELLALRQVLDLVEGWRQSGRPSRSELLRQLASHRTRLGLGLRIGPMEWAQVSIIADGDDIPAVLVLPRNDPPAKRARHFQYRPG